MAKEYGLFTKEELRQPPLTLLQHADQEYRKAKNERLQVEKDEVEKIYHLDTLSEEYYIMLKLYPEGTGQSALWHEKQKQVNDAYLLVVKRIKDMEAQRKGESNEDNTR